MQSRSTAASAEPIDAAFSRYEHTIDIAEDGVNPRQARACASTEGVELNRERPVTRYA
ncbi:hypothetical protein [Streptomyces sp. NPDC001642]|uniref:hypothetical protein n=1 Tax=Streptomyces sp. NPDC001642 TaxID=3154392 RepID=UPI00331A13E5